MCVGILVGFGEEMHVSMHIRRLKVVGLFTVFALRDIARDRFIGSPRNVFFSLMVKLNKGSFPRQ